MRTLGRTAPVFVFIAVAALAASLSGCGGTQQPTALSTAPGATKPATQKVKVDDMEVAYRVYGTGDPLLILTGSSSTQDDWDPNVISRLAKKYKVITLDHRGMGLSTAGAKEFTMKQFADDVAGFMDAFKMKKADVLGWSMGTNVAQELALAHPDKVNNLVLYAADPGGPQYVQPSADVQQKLSDTSGGLLEQAQRQLPLLFPAGWWADPNNQAYIFKTLGSSSEPMPQESLAKQDQAMRDWGGTWERLPTLKSRTLLLTGADDVITPPQNSQVMAGRIRGAKLVQITGGGHGVQFQYPEKFADTVLEFLSGK
jgi:pimeloyl-ACP methyl ester carboxylesterase